MKVYSQFQNITKIFLFFAISLQSTGCATKKIVSSGSDLTVRNKFYYILHVNNSEILLKNVAIKNFILSGKMDTEGVSVFGNKIHLYLSSASDMRVSFDDTVYIPIDLVKVETVTIWRHLN